jgi:hypothetical protein
MLEATSAATQTPMSTTTASGLEEEPPATTENEALNVASPVKRAEDQGTPDSSVNYVIFGVLVVLLVGGLIFLRIR